MKKIAQTTVTRFEVIDHRKYCKDNPVNGGRVLTCYNVNVELSYQDGGQTLKVFITDEPKKT